MENSNSSRESIIVSVLNFQNNTENFGLRKGVLLRDKSKNIVGFLGILPLKMMYKENEYIFAQTSSAFIHKDFRGTFNKLLIEFDKINSGFNKLTIYPIPTINKKFLSRGYKALNNTDIQYEYHLIFNFYSFFLNKSTLFKNIIMKYLMNILEKFFIRIIQKSNVLFLKNLNYDYSLLEKNYYEMNSNFCVSVWNQEMLSLKYGNKLGNIDKIRENEVLHYAIFDEHNKVTASLFLKKIRNVNKVIISDFKILNNDKKLITDLISQAIFDLKKTRINSIIFYGLRREIQNAIKTKFFTLKKKKNLNVFVKIENDLLLENIKIDYCDDDMNY